MIFTSYKNIEQDIKTRISNYIKENENISDVSNIISLIRSYLHEMKIIKEINNYKVTEINNKEFYINIIHINTEHKFKISIDLEIRNLKINKIKSHNLACDNYNAYICQL